MGIDVYLQWQEMTEEDRKAQYLGFEVSARAGSVGYLREAYHGGPYSTEVLVPEGFEDDSEDGVPIPVETLRERLPAAIQAAHERGRTVYKNPEGDPTMELALRAFLETAERLAAEGKVPRVRVGY